MTYQRFKWVYYWSVKFFHYLFFSLSTFITNTVIISKFVCLHWGINYCDLHYLYHILMARLVLQLFLFLTSLSYMWKSWIWLVIVPRQLWGNLLLVWPQPLFWDPTTMCPQHLVEASTWITSVEIRYSQILYTKEVRFCLNCLESLVLGKIYKSLILISRSNK